MFQRLPTFEEESEMHFINAIAIEVKQSELSSVIKLAVKVNIPKYLKRVKKIGDSVLLLTDIGTPNNSSEIAVKIPAFEPITSEQHFEALQMWPCHFYNHKTDPIDQKNVNTKAHELNRLYQEQKHKIVECCSSICIIYDGDELLDLSVDSEIIAGHAVTDCITKVSQSKRGYLCTGFTAFLYKEPCTSCAMALVHGRISKVFVLHKGNEMPYSKHKLNHCKDLNHRYEVYFHINNSQT